LRRQQEVPIHGSQHAKTRSRVEGENSRHTEDTEHGAVFEDTPGQSQSLLSQCKCEAHKVQPNSDPIETTFELNDTLFAKALVAPTEEVYLWLGANVMLSYPLPEAETLLESKLSAAQTSMTNCEEDLDFLREQITTLEVATARVYNWDVAMRRKEKADGGESSKGGEKGGPNG